MTRTYMTTLLTLSLAAFSAHSLTADVRTDEKTQVQFEGGLGRMMNLFGGKAAKEGVTSTVAVKGDRKIRLSDNAGQIIDLSEEKIYDLDMRKKTYKVTTFAEMRRRLEEAQKKAQEQARRDPGAASSRDSNAKEMDVDFDIKETGEKKTIAGFDTHEVVMTITLREKGKKLEESGGMVLTSDMWMTSSIAAMKEVSEFNIRYARALAGPEVSGASPQEMAAALAMYPTMKQALERMNTEGVKMDGTSILTKMTMDSVKSADQVAQEEKQSENQSKSSSSSGGGLLGGLAKRALQQKKGPDENKPRSTFMTTTTEVLKVATEVSATDVAIPAGFKENK